MRSGVKNCSWSLLDIRLFSRLSCIRRTLLRKHTCIRCFVARFDHPLLLGTSILLKCFVVHKTSDQAPRFEDDSATSFSIVFHWCVEGYGSRYIGRIPLQLSRDSGKQLQMYMWAPRGCQNKDTDELCFSLAPCGWQFCLRTVSAIQKISTDLRWFPDRRYP